MAQIQSRSPKVQKDVTIMLNSLHPSASSTSGNMTAAPGQPKLAPPADPLEVLLLASIPVTDNDFEALATERAKAVRTYILGTGKVEASRLFLTENQTGGVRGDGSRAYLQFR
jgi:hypothetical protein